MCVSVFIALKYEFEMCSFFHTLLKIAMHLFLHKPFYFLLFLLFLLQLHLQCNGSNGSIVPAVIVFGDSVVDTGNNNNLETIFKVNYPPYGQDFSGGQPTGRFSNGKVPSDFLVEELGVKDVLPPYLDSNLKDEELLTGVNFASGGGGYDPLTSELASVISLEGQIELFKEYMGKVKSMAGEEVLNTILSKGLFIVATGSNDATNTYFNNPLRLYHYDFDSYTRLMVNSASSFLQDLYNLGARRIGVFGIPPIGCLPSQRTLKGGTLRECAEKYNELAALFNTKLSREIDYLNHNLPFARMVYVDGYYLPLDIIQNPTKYGFDVSNIGCCGTGTIEVAFLCKYTCTNVSEYVFWDSFHFTENAYRIIVRDFISKNMNLIM